MDKIQAFQLLERGLNIANKVGAFTLLDAKYLMTALDILREDYPTSEQDTPEDSKQETKDPA